MMFFAVAFALLLHVSYWGAGLAIAIMPKPWRRFWPIIALPTGWVLQSAVVWVGAYCDLRGTDAYAWYAEVIPAVLLLLALVRRGWRELRLDVSRFGLVWIAMVAAMIAMLIPLPIASHGLTTISLGSCDAADYAAGARVFKEFAHSDRQGFLGLTEVVHVMSADNFYDFWLRLNHFTPSALMALNGSIFDCEPFQLATLLTIVILATAVPTVFWVSRAVFGYSGAASLIIAAVFGISPITWYSVAHVSPAPLLAAQALALLNWAGIALWRGKLTWRRGIQFAGILAIGYALVLGSYNFILIVSLVPAVAFAGGQTLATASWRRLARWILIMVTPLVGCGFFFGGRVTGLVERFMLFQTYDFGWRIPLLTPEGWLGMVQGVTLNSWSWAGIRWGLAAVVLVVWLWAIIRSLRRNGPRIWVVASVTVPVMFGYAFLEWRGARLGTNASYDAFKLLTVFYPLLLPAFCWWITLRWSAQLFNWAVIAGVAAGVVAMNLVGCVMYVVRLSHPPLVVTSEIRQLQKIEAMPEVQSINMSIPDMWTRLWANSFLLRKAQYFSVHTYEGRLNTVLRGDYDLRSGTLRVMPDDGSSRQVTPHFVLINRRGPLFLQVNIGDGWFSMERHGGGDRWRWTRGDATVRINNPHPYPVAMRVTLDARAIADRNITISVAGVVPPAPIHMDKRRRQATTSIMIAPPGRSTLLLHSDQPPVKVSGDARSLSLCVFSLSVEPTTNR
jgi:hypothetical protein